MKRRGYLPPVIPARRRRFEVSPPPNPPRPTNNRGEDGRDDGFTIWEDVIDEEALAQNLEMVVEEDIEPPDNAHTLQPLQTNLLGVEWGDNADDIEGDMNSEDEKRFETVGGSTLADDTTPDPLPDPNNMSDITTVADAGLDHHAEAPLVAVDAPGGIGNANDKVVEEIPIVVDSQGENLDHCGEDFHMAMMLFVTSSDLSTTQYEALTEVLALATPETLKSLPKSITTLKQRCRRAFPLMDIKARLVDVELNQIPPRKETPRNAYFFEPSDYCKLWLSTPNIRMHQGLGEFVDVSSELYHGDAWMESVRSTSGQFAFINEDISASRVTLLPSDCVVYTNSEGKTALGRVKCIGIDKRQGRQQQPCALINPLVPVDQLPIEWAVREPEFDPFTYHPYPLTSLPELILIENTREIIPCKDITRRIWVFFADYHQSVNDLKDSLLPVSPNFCVRSVAYEYDGEYSIRPVHKRHHVLAEVELTELTRKYVLDSYIQDPGKTRRISVPYSVFLDGFGLYRNAYYSLKGMYLTPAGMDVFDRTRLANMFVLMIGPFGSNEQQMAACLRMDAIAIGRGVHMKLDGGENVFVTSFPLLITGDMPQQNQNSGAKTHRAEFGCRSCFVPDKERKDMRYNVMGMGRYRQQVEYLFNLAKSMRSKAATDKALKKVGLTSIGPYFRHCYTMLDSQRCLPNDPMHAELRLCKYFAEVLLEGVLSTEGIKAYLAAWNIIQMPYGWGQPQNPVTHKGSMVFNEHGRIAIINPFVLMHLFTNDQWPYHEGSEQELRSKRSSYIKKTAQARMEVEFADLVGDRHYSGALVRTAWMLARCVTLTLQETLSTREKTEFKQVVVNSRTMLQRVFTCASADTKTFKNYANVPNIHLALHYQQDIENYATARNATTMMGEQKHKIFKLHAPHTNSKDVDLQLMRATNTAQSIRFILDGAFSQSAPNITKQIRTVVDRCPTMSARFLGANDRLCLGEGEIPGWRGIDVTNSLFWKATTSLSTPVKTVSADEVYRDNENKYRLFHTEYQTELLSVVTARIHYWRYFSAEKKEGRGRVRDRFKLRSDQIVKLRDGPYSFYRVMRIYTVTVGTMIRVFFVLRALQSVQQDVSVMAPGYRVFCTTESEEITVGIKSIDPTTLHFVAKGRNIWWYNPYLPSFL